MNSYDILKKIKEMYKISTNYFNKYGNLKIIQKNRIRMLEKIGMVLSIIDRVGKKEELCNEYLIPYEDVKNISYNELYAKTMYLLDNNIDIIIDDKLNPVYNMSNTNMQVNYGVSLEELIEKYKKKEKEK